MTDAPSKTEGDGLFLCLLSDFLELKWTVASQSMPWNPGGEGRPPAGNAKDNNGFQLPLFDHRQDLGDVLLHVGATARIFVLFCPAAAAPAAAPAPGSATPPALLKTFTCHESKR